MPLPIAQSLFQQIFGSSLPTVSLTKPTETSDQEGEDVVRRGPAISFQDVLTRQFLGPTVLPKTMDTSSGKVFAPDDPIPAKPDILATYPQSTDQQRIISSPMPAGEPKGIMGLPIPETQDKLKGFEKPQDVDMTKLSKDISFEDYKNLVNKGKINIASETDEEDFNKVLNKKIRAEVFRVPENTPFAESYEMGDLEEKAKAKKLYYEDDMHGTFYVGTSKSDVQELKYAETPYDYGKIYNYPEEDIAHFYTKRRGGDLKYGYEEFLSDRNHYLNKKILVGENKSSLKTQDLPVEDIQKQIQVKKSKLVNTYDFIYNGKIVGQIEKRKEKFKGLNDYDLIDTAINDGAPFDAQLGFNDAKSAMLKGLANQIKNKELDLDNYKLVEDYYGDIIKTKKEINSNPTGSLIDKPLSNE